jgi:hypothetical protein
MNQGSILWSSVSQTRFRETLRSHRKPLGVQREIAGIPRKIIIIPGNITIIFVRLFEIVNYTQTLKVKKGVADRNQNGLTGWWKTQGSWAGEIG